MPFRSWKRTRDFVAIVAPFFTGTSRRMQKRARQDDGRGAGKWQTKPPQHPVYRGRIYRITRHNRAADAGGGGVTTGLH